MPCDVLISGAGPVGLTMAAELARYGLSVRIVDLAAQRTDKSKALVIWSRTLELIHRMGCAQSFLDNGLKATAANIIAGSKRIAHISLTGVASPYPFALMIPQSETERLMEAHLNSYGVQVERSTQLLNFTDAGDHVVSTLRLPDGTEESVTSSWLIGCDGAHSTVRHQLGAGFEGTTMPSNWILADLHLSGVPDHGEINIFWHSDGILALFPIDKNRYRVITDVSNSGSADIHPADPTLPQIQSMLDTRGPGGIVASDPFWLAGFRINERKVADYRVGRVFLAGDAAHIHSPAGGQGMNTGMQDACNLAWKLALVARGIASGDGPLLPSYSAERSIVGDKILKESGMLTSIAIMHGSVEQSLRNHLAALLFGLSPVRKAMAETLTELSIGYPDSPLNGPSNPLVEGPAAGQRAPIRPTDAPFGGGDTPLFALSAAANDAIAALIARYPNLLEPKVRGPFHESGLWLVRPDGYVALATRPSDPADVDVFLKSIAV